jgi:hypothetical protein
MLFITYKIMPKVIGCLILLSLADKSVKAVEHYSLFDTSYVSKSDGSKGYNDIVFFKDRFITVGTDGRIDCIYKSGERIPVDNSSIYKLNCAFSYGEILIAAGDHGTILYSSDGKSFYRTESGTDKNLNGITFKNGLIIAGADNGTILTSKNGISWNIVPTKIKGNIVSLTANNSFFIGISDSGEIIKSFDGIIWEIQDYNKEYAGYNKYSKFKKILATQNSIIIIGTHDDGSPSILFSSLGNVWTEREPIYQDDQGIVQCLTRKPNGITYDTERDQFILACDNGELLTLPPCSKCNKHAKISETDFNALIYSDDCLLIVGNDYSVFSQRLR